MVARVAKKVLVVEDNELNLKLFCDLLRAHDYLAEPVRDGREAVVRAREFAPDLIIMDIQMPHVTGYEIILELKADDVLDDAGGIADGSRKYLQEWMDAYLAWVDLHA